MFLILRDQLKFDYQYSIISLDSAELQMLLLRLTPEINCQTTRAVLVT